MRAVRRLFAHEWLARPEVLGLLALMSRQGLDQHGEEIVLIAADTLEEGRLHEGVELIVPMLW